MTPEEFARSSAWATFVAAQIGFSHHPGTTRDNAKPRALQEICAEADQYIKEYDIRFHVKHGDNNG